MKKQLSASLLAISIFGLNVLPATAATNKDNQTKSSSTAIANGQWCVEIPWMGLFCWDL
jgi:hypothetical protein